MQSIVEAKQKKRGVGISHELTPDSTTSVVSGDMTMMDYSVLLHPPALLDNNWISLLLGDSHNMPTKDRKSVLSFKSVSNQFQISFPACWE